MFLEEMIKRNLLTQKQIADFKAGEVLIKVYKDTICMGRVISADNEKIVLESIIDLNAATMIAEQGFMKILENESYYSVDTDFSFDECKDALSAIETSALYTANPAKKKEIVSFTASVFPPRFILFLKKKNMLSTIFVPAQQKLRIGKYTGLEKWEDVNKTRFRSMLEELCENEYITYMACLPEGRSKKALFFTSGTETHVETDKKLKKELPSCQTNCGGNIKLYRKDGETKYYIVDAGSNFKGHGVDASIEEASSVSSYLKNLFPDFKFIPAHGRGGVGSKSSF